MLTANEAKNISEENKKKTYSDIFNKIMDEIENTAKEGRTSLSWYDEDNLLHDWEADQFEDLGYEIEWNSENKYWYISW